MIDTPYTLQAHPILEPHHSRSPLVQIALPTAGGQTFGEKVLNEHLDGLPRPGSHIASLAIHSNRRPAPNYQVRDSGHKTVGPVILENREIPGIREWRGGVVGEGRR